MPPEQNTAQPEPKTNGALIGSVIIIIILIIGGIYLWKTSKETAPIDFPSSDTVGTSDTSSAEAELETELNGMDLEGLDQGI